MIVIDIDPAVALVKKSHAIITDDKGYNTRKVFILGLALLGCA